MKSFANWDIYYLYEYAQGFMLHGDGEPLLIEYRDDDAHFCYAMMKSDIADAPAFCGILERQKYYDMETPYGYGGPLSDGEVTEASQKRFLKELKDYCGMEGIVSQFIRFHPLLQNHVLMPFVFETRYMRDTIYMDTASPELISANMDSKNRNMVRKAIKSGVTIERRAIDQYSEFLPMYEETMLKDEAAAYYTFQKDYFDAQSELKDNACIFYAMYEEQPIAGAMMYYNDRFMHYHLAGTHTEYRKFAPSNLMLYEAACWASTQGIQKFHLGGGMAADDNLFGFKKQFNKSGRLPFVIGRTIFDKSVYQKLLHMRKQANSTFDMENGRMIQYR